MIDCIKQGDADHEKHNQYDEQQDNNTNETKYYRIAMVCDFFHPRLGGVENHILSLSQHLILRGHKVIVITHSYCHDNNHSGGDDDDNGGPYKGVRYIPVRGHHHFDCSTGAADDASSPSVVDAAIKVYYCPILPMTDQDVLPTFSATLPLIRHILLRESIDLVHAHQATSTMANECLIFASALNIPSIYTDHSLFAVHTDLASVILNRVLQTTLCTVDGVIAVSHACRDNLILRAHLVHPSEPASTNPAGGPPCSNQNNNNNNNNNGLLVRVIPNAVNADQFTPAPSLSSSPLSDKQTNAFTRVDDRDRIKVVVISRLVYRKGIDLLVGVIPVVCRQLEMVDFIIGGDGNKLLALQEMVERERLESRVEFLGAIPHHRVCYVLRRGHVFLNCSLTESFCIAILEAACCGLLVVSTDVGGVPEVLPPDLMLLAPPNVKALAGRLIEAIHLREKQLFSDDTVTVDPMVTHQRVKDMYSWQRAAVETEQVYQIIIQRRRDNPYRSSLHYRLPRYASLGWMYGTIVCLLILTLELWLRCIDWWQPADCIDRVPDLLFSSPRKKQSKSSKDDSPK